MKILGLTIHTITPDHLMQLTAPQIKCFVMACGIRINQLRTAIEQTPALDELLSEEWRAIVAVRKTLFTRLFELETESSTSTPALAHAA